jgi:hypothetical protein
MVWFIFLNRPFSIDKDSGGESQLWFEVQAIYGNGVDACLLKKLNLFLFKIKVFYIVFMY